ncbi:MAG: hypothetical protein M1818_003480 [Claussenomyces sp. TS43310]|nr:MAG: hypothetical protein M1818_003480 [Claussenomyces sp. TS43310]
MKDATPAEVDRLEIPDGAIFTQLAASGNATFALTDTGLVYGWGTFRDHSKVTCIKGGIQHSIAVTENGECLVWGRLDGYATGMKLDNLPAERTIRDLRDSPRNLKVPTPIPELDAVFAAAGSDHSIAITKDHKAFSWSFNVDRQTGQKTADDVECVTLLDHPSIKGKRLVWAGAGGQYSMLGAEDDSVVNDGY